MTLTTPRLERSFRFQGCFNFRDLGGYEGPGERTVRWRRLFRSDSLVGLSPLDCDRLAELQVETLILLHTPTGPSSDTAPEVGATTVHLPMNAVLPPGEPLTGLMHGAFLASRYHDVLRQGTETVCESLAILTDPSLYPVVLACGDGRDRVGIVTAIVLGLLGVPDEVIVADYLLSREAMVRRFDRMRHEQRPVPNDVVLHRASMATVLPETMAGFIAILRAEYGSFDGYARAVDMEGVVPHLRRALMTA